MRPEAVSLANGATRDIVLDGKVAEVSFLGSVIRLKVDLGDNAVNLDTFNDQRTPPPAPGAPVRIGIAPIIGVKARAFLTMEGAAGPHVAALRLALALVPDDVLAHHLRDRQALPDLIEEAVGKAHGR
jgi:hypothetical protein